MNPDIIQQELSEAETKEILADNLNIEIKLAAVLSPETPTVLMRGPGQTTCLLILASLNRDGTRSISMWKFTGGHKNERDKFVKDFILHFNKSCGGEIIKYAP